MVVNFFFLLSLGTMSLVKCEENTLGKQKEKAKDRTKGRKNIKRHCA